MTNGTLDGSVYVVTGASSGLGLAATDALTERGATVIMAVRNPGKGEDARRTLSAKDRAEVMTLDVADLASVEAFAVGLLDRFDRLDGLLNNAGVMATPPELTDDGIELQWATNHLGHFALTGRLLDLLTSTDSSRVVAVSSLAATGGNLRNYDPTSLSGYQRLSAYANSKLANLVFALELDRRLTATGASTIALAAHPGITHTNLVSNIRIPGVQQWLKMMSRLTTQSAAAGARPLLKALCDRSASGGQYWGPSGWNQYRGSARVIPLPAGAADRSVGERLWSQSVEQSGVSYLIANDGD